MDLLIYTESYTFKQEKLGEMRLVSYDVINRFASSEISTFETKTISM